MKANDPKKSPEYREALEAEQVSRDSAFLYDLLPRKLCGIRVNELTLNHLLLLRLSDNPFVCGFKSSNPPSPFDVANLLWIISPHYNPKAKIRRFLFLRSVSRAPFLEITKAIVDYINESFLDSPANQEGKTAVQRISAAGVFVDLICGEYSWPKEEVLDTPLRILFQLMRARATRLGFHYVSGGPSDMIVQAWLDKRNAKPTPRIEL